MYVCRASMALAALPAEGRAGAVPRVHACNVSIAVCACRPLRGTHRAHSVRLRCQYFRRPHPPQGATWIPEHCGPALPSPARLSFYSPSGAHDLLQAPRAARMEHDVCVAVCVRCRARQVYAAAGCLIFSMYLVRIAHGATEVCHSGAAP